jgi:hypothetical protein
MQPSPRCGVLLRDAVDVAGVQHHFARAHAHHFVVRTVGLLDDLESALVRLRSHSSELRHHHAAVRAVMVDVRRRQALPGDARDVSLCNVTLLQRRHRRTR